MSNEIISVSAFRRASGCEKLKSLYQLRLEKGMGLLRAQACEMFCKMFASGAEFSVIEGRLRQLYAENESCGAQDCPLEWQFDAETEFDIKLFKRLYAYLTADYMPSAKAEAVGACFTVNSPENGLKQICSLLFEREDGSVDAFVLEYKNSNGVSAKARTEVNKVENDLRLLVLLHGLSEK